MDFDVEFVYMFRGHMIISAENAEMAAGFAKETIEEKEFDIGIDGDQGEYDISVVNVQPIKVFDIWYDHVQPSKVRLEAISEEAAIQQVTSADWRQNSWDVDISANIENRITKIEEVKRGQ